LQWQIRDIYFCSKKIATMKFSELYRLLEKDGWILKQGKRHARYVKSGYPPIPVGRHPFKGSPEGNAGSDTQRKRTEINLLLHRHFVKSEKKMNMRKITAVIEKANDGGYGIYCPELKSIMLYGHGLSEQEAKENLNENLECILEHYEEEGEPAPEAIAGKTAFDYRYDFSGFFKAYSIFNASELAASIGINPSLMRKYKNGHAFASSTQRKKIESAIHALSKQLGTVRF
jgi:predicted RNase H-like HicB family nuclease